jgi:DNA invertase Pin-like site-specific DNA recombinase
LHDPWCDTSTPHGKLLVTVLGGLAEFERTLIAARTGEGRKRAKARGVKFGRKPKLTDYQRDQALAMVAEGKLSLVEIGKTFGVAHTTISRTAGAAAAG